MAVTVEANVCDSWTKYESDLLRHMQVDNGASDYVPSSIEEGDFEANIAFSFLHECSPRMVSQKVIDLSSAGSRVVLEGTVRCSKQLELRFYAPASMCQYTLYI